MRRGQRTFRPGNKEDRHSLVSAFLHIVAKTATMSKQHSTLSTRQYFTINSFDIVAVFGNKVECCFNIVAGVDMA